MHSNNSNHSIICRSVKNMKFIAIFLSMVMTIAVVTGQSSNLETFMINGTDAGHVRFFAYLEIFKELDFGGVVYFGGGSLIRSTLILTVAQNVEGFESWRVGLGANQITNMEWFSSNEAFVHEDYDNDTLANNIAVIRLSQAAPISHQIANIGLPPIGYVGIRDGSGVNIFGFGFDVENCQPEILQRASLTVTTEAVCETRYPHMRLSGQISNYFCARNVSTTSAISICAGDQGGPVQEITTAYIIGIQSFYRIDDCASPDAQPAAFIRVAPYRQWIDQFI